MFVDTNVLVYARFGTAPDHVNAADFVRHGDRLELVDLP